MKIYGKQVITETWVEEVTYQLSIFCYVSLLEGIHAYPCLCIFYPLFSTFIPCDPWWGNFPSMTSRMIYSEGPFVPFWIRYSSSNSWLVKGLNKKTKLDMLTWFQLSFPCHSWYLPLRFVIQLDREDTIGDLQQGNVQTYTIATS